MWRSEDRSMSLKCVQNHFYVDKNKPETVKCGKVNIR